MMVNPLVSVLLPVYNCENYIKDCIDSILNQTFSDFELLIIDDKSTDTTVAVIQQYTDERIKLTVKEQNSGYTNSLNWAIDQAKGKYIARMDGDDICLPNRFEKQVAFLEANPEVILCGTGMEVIGNPIGYLQPENHQDIKIKLCFSTSFFHPSVMGKKEVFVENKYKPEFEPAEDYELWTRLVFKGQLANISEVLLQYRVHLSQVSSTKNTTQANNAFQCKLNMLNHLNILDNFTKEQIRIALDVYSDYTFEDCQNSLAFFKYLTSTNTKLQVFEESGFNDKIRQVRISFLKRYLEKGKGNKVIKAWFLVQKISFSDFRKVMRVTKRVGGRLSKIIDI